MAFPSPTLAPPALGLYQWSFGGLTFGGIAAGGAYQILSAIEDMPDVASGDVQRALDQGEFAGVDILPGRDVTIRQVVTTGGLPRTGMPTLAQAIAIDQACQALGGVMSPGGTVEQPLYIQKASGLFASMARARKHNCPWDINRVMAGGALATSLLHSTDPRWYATPTMSQTVGLPAAIGGGLIIPATFPAAFGSGAVGGLLTVVNSGRFESRPILVITGPCVNPLVANLSTPGAPAIGALITLNAGDTLTIDTDWQSVILTSAGSSIGAPRRNALTTGTTWWNLPAASSSTIEFTSADTSPVSGTLTVQSASAYLSL